MFLFYIGTPYELSKKRITLLTIDPVIQWTEKAARRFAEDLLDTPKLTYTYGKDRVFDYVLLFTGISVITLFFLAGFLLAKICRPRFPLPPLNALNERADAPANETVDQPPPSQSSTPGAYEEALEDIHGDAFQEIAL